MTNEAAPKGSITHQRLRPKRRKDDRTSVVVISKSGVIKFDLVLKDPEIRTPPKNLYRTLHRNVMDVYVTCKIKY